MTVRSRQEVADKIAADLPNNGAKQITAEKLRGVLTDVADSAPFRAGGSPHLLDFVPSAEHPGIAAATSTFACDQAFTAAVASLPAGGGAVRLPPGKLKFADTINLKKMVVLDGVGTGQDGGRGTELSFPNDRDWIVVNRHNTLGSGLEAPSTGAADGSILRGVLLSTPSRGAVGHGIRARARFSAYDVRITNAGEDGLHIVAASDGGAETLGNANNWHAERMRITNCGRHGMFVDSTDVNAGNAIAIDCSDNVGWGIYDSSFLGNTYVGCHAAANGLGPYKADDPNAHCVFAGCYSEGGQNPSDFLTGRHLILSGLHGAGCTVGGQSLWLRQGFITPFTVPSNNGTRDLAWRTIGNVGGISFQAAGDDETGWQLPYWDEASKTWQFRHAMLDARVAVALTTKLSMLLDEAGQVIPAGELVFTKPYWVPASAGRFKKISL